MEGDEVLEAIFAYISRDEAAHADFYRTVIAIDISEQRTSTSSGLRLPLVPLQNANRPIDSGLSATAQT
jgi:hypothetical protein